MPNQPPLISFLMSLDSSTEWSGGKNIYGLAVKTIESGLSPALPDNDLPDITDPVSFWLNGLRRQVDLSGEIVRVLREKGFSQVARGYFSCLVFDAFLRNAHALLERIRQGYHASPVNSKQKKGVAVIEKAFKRELLPSLTGTHFLPPEDLEFLDYQPCFVSRLEQKVAWDLATFIRILEPVIHGAEREPSGDAAQLFDLVNKTQQSMEEHKEWHLPRKNCTPPILQTRRSSPESGTCENPVVSIISPSFNTGKFMDDTIQSILGQNSSDWEHIVIDGASTDNSLETLNKYPHIRLVSERDSGFGEAFRKGLAMARGEFIITCCISDCYLDPAWLEKCIHVLRTRPEVSLVWAYPQWANEEGILGDISYPQFHDFMPPQKQDFFFYWLETGFWLPEGNFCVRKKVMDECFPPWPNPTNEEHDVFLDFNFNLHRAGYMGFFLNSVANLGRIHEGQSGQREHAEGLMSRRVANYHKKREAYLRQLRNGTERHLFRDGESRPIDTIAATELLSRARKIQSRLRVKKLLAGLKTFERKILSRLYPKNIKKAFMTHRV